MINKDNWRMVQEYLRYRSEVDQICNGSKDKEITHLRFLLRWADEKGFAIAPKIRPVFPDYVTTHRLDNGDKVLSPQYIKKVLATSRRFFIWLIENKSGYRSVTHAWVKTIKVKRLTEIPKNRIAVSLEEILAIAKAPVVSINDRRIRAAAVFLFLSGMRISAFISLPIKAVDLNRLQVKQFPSLGVRTKNSKHETTFLLNISELLTVVREWDKEIRESLSDDSFWFAPLDPRTGKLDATYKELGKHRETLARRNLKDWLEKVGLPYYSPHKFRHGHIHYGLINSKNIADYKAVSSNVMHSDMGITDQFYSNQAGSEIQNRINSLGGSKKTNTPLEEIESAISLLEKLKREIS